MLYIQSFVFNGFHENTYIVSNEKKHCWIVDPGMFDTNETNHLKNFIRQNQLVPQAIINTHAHLDHIFGVQPLVDAYGLPFHLHEKEMPVLKNASVSAAMFGIRFNPTFQPSAFIKEGEPLMLADDEIEVRFAPGHSPGSIVFYYSAGSWALSGDVLFSGSIGRTDLPGGNFDTLIQSIREQMFTLPDDTVVYSGHGPATTIGNEKIYNPFLQ